jgi:hypothetical protein
MVHKRLVDEQSYVCHQIDHQQYEGRIFQLATTATSASGKLLLKFA